MKTPLLLISLFLATGCAAGSQNRTETKAMPDEGGTATSVLPAELSTAHAGLLRAWQGKDPLAMRPYYADDAVVVTRTDRFEGWYELQTRWLTPTLQQLSGFMAMPTSFKRVGAVIHEQGRYSYRMVENGREQEFEGVYAQQWQQQQNGHWRVTAATVTAF
jgi:ketosteroid isomerase-like protein